MNKITLAACFAVAFVFSGCTVHHYHHRVGTHACKQKKSHRGGHDGAQHGLPPGHPPVKGMRGHGKMLKGHGMRGHGKMPKGHGMQGHGMQGHGMQGHGALPPGHPPMDGHGGGSDADSGRGEGDAIENPFAKSHHGEQGAQGDEEHAHDNMAPEIVAFHDSFAGAWHKDDDAARRTAACAQVAEWKKLALAVKKLTGGVVFAAATKDLQKQTLAVASTCARKNGDVQAALTATHDALHMVFLVAAKSSADEPAKAENLKPGF